MSNSRLSTRGGLKPTNAVANPITDEMKKEEAKTGELLKANSTRVTGDTPWSGSEKILIAIDCGSTFSGVTYSFLFPRGKWSIQRVVEWPGQDSQKGEAKIPTVVWYDKDGTAQAFGAEAMTARVKAQAMQDDWKLAEEFKLSLHPIHMTKGSSIEAPPLPYGVSLDRVYADFFRYLYTSTERFFKKMEFDGSRIWDQYKDEADFVLAHPNAWGAYEQDFMRKAAIKGGLVTEKDAKTRVHFVTEAEASVHFVMAHSDIEHRLEPGHEFIVCDAGGSTVDTTLYKVARTKPFLELEEKLSSACVSVGAIHVNRSAKRHFELLFSSAGFQTNEIQEYIEEIIESFETETKRNFSGDPGEVFIKVGGQRFTERSIGVRRGLMTIDNNTIAKFFLPSTQKIVQSVNQQMKGHSAKTILLVGGYGDSAFLRRQLKEDPPIGKLELTLANEPTAKAVADGSAIWYILRSVTARAARFSFGVAVREQYMSFHQHHRGRPIHTDVSGTWVRNVWSPIVQKDEILRNDQDRRKDYSKTFLTGNPELSNIEIDLYAFTEATPAPYYVSAIDYLYTGLNPGFTQACTIVADMSQARAALQRHVGPGGPYWKIYYQVAIFFGRTELSAALIWKDAQDNEHQGPATVIPMRFT